ncbi:hypothetical protein HX109_15485 [Galbibacter sp. BG1]|uniref:hypothetical protein n=1 Tax=Galbibacter sp. BG1 TaxID=1170699 RepID=UPI0015BB144D|nr:hypothetical protein [Galbibacter sp. BG1]QLE02902.1 hypothetical protein HX109_15485 [Galbibacter sp. BG1]
MNDVIKNQLDEICQEGKIIKWQGRLYEPQKYKVLNGHIVIVATPKSIKLDYSNVHDFLDSVQTKESLSSLTTKADNSPFLQKFGRVDYDKLNDGLMDAFERVQNDENFIPKAKQMCDIVNSVTNLQKTKISLLKLAENNI